MSELADRIRTRLFAAADPGKAPAMQAYMKTEQPFLGVQMPLRRKIAKEAFKQSPRLSFEEYNSAVDDLWRGVHREEMYQALEVAEHYREHIGPQSWELYEQLVRESPNWDLLDWVAPKLSGAILLRHREYESNIRAWARDGNLWVRRAAILVHLKHKQATNRELLAETILLLAPEKEFFIRKAIGWALREYSYTAPQWVITFVKRHEARLSPLSRREALKAINRKAAVIQ